MSSDVATPDPRPLGVIYMLLCAACFCLMGIMVRLLVIERGENVFWLGWIRFMLGGLAMWLPSLTGAWPLQINNRGVFVLRGVIGSVGMFMLYLAISLVGLGRGTVLMYLMGVVGAVSGIFILRERPTARLAAAVAIGTAGVLLSCRSGFPRGAEWLPVIGAICSGTTLSLIRLLRRTDSNQVVFFSQGLFGSLLLLPFLCGSRPPHGAASWGLLAVLIASDVAGQLCMNESLARLPVALASSLMLLTPVLSLFAGVGLFAETLAPMQWLGCAMVLGGALLSVAGNRPGASPAAASAEGPVPS